MILGVTVILAVACSCTIDFYNELRNAIEALWSSRRQGPVVDIRLRNAVEALWSSREAGDRDADHIRILKVELYIITPRRDPIIVR